VTTPQPPRTAQGHAGPQPGERPSPLRANPDFRRLWIGQAASELGSSISNLALPLLVLATTRSATLTGLTGTLVFAVAWILQLPAGYAADRYNRRTIMITCDAVRGVAQLALVAGILTHTLPLGLILGLVVISTAAWTFFGPAQARAIRTIVQREQIIEAIAANTARSYAADLAGPFLSGLLFTAGRFIPFLADAASFTISAGSISRLHCHLGRNPQARTPGTALAEVRRGWSYTWGDSFLRASMLYSAGSNFVATALIFAIIIIAGGHAGSGTPIGGALTIAAGGGVVGAALAPKVQRRFTIRQVLIFTGTVRTVLIAAFALTRQPLILGGILAAFITLSPTANTALSALRTQLVPSEILGKITATTSFVATALQPLAPLSAGLMLARLGHTATILSLAFVMLTVIAYIHIAAGFKQPGNGHDASGGGTANDGRPVGERLPGSSDA
jgi:MFS family permease